MRPASILLFLAIALTSCTSSEGPSGASQVTMQVLRWMNLKGNSLTRVKAGLPYVEDSAQQPKPTASFVKKHLVTSTLVDGHTVYTLAARDKASTSTILYLHGGAYSISFVSTHWKLFENLIKQTACTIVAPDYPLPPNSDWTESWAMVEKVYASLVQKDSNSAPILMGDSAGGGFALAFAQDLISKDQLAPQKLILLSPWLDLSMANPDISLMEKSDPILSAEALRISAKLWAGKTPLDDWHLSPLYGPLGKLPQITLFTGTSDILNPDAKKLKQRFSDANINLDYREYPGMMHVWMLFDFPESTKAQKELVSLIHDN